MKVAKERPKLPQDSRSSRFDLDLIPGERYRVLTGAEMWEGIFVGESKGLASFKRDSILSQKALSHDGVVESLPGDWKVAIAAIQRTQLWEP